MVCAQSPDPAYKLTPPLSKSASIALNFTGERFAPEVTGAIWYEHWHRYCVA